MALMLQLYSMRNHPDQLGLLAELPGMGITGVEGYGGVYGDAAAYRAAMDANGISMPSGHFGLDDLESDFDGMLALAGKLGVRKIFAPYLAAEDRPKDAAGYRALASRLNDLARRFAHHDHPFGWHNHEFEFEALPDGAIPMEILLEEAPDILWEADLAWVVRGGKDPIEYINRYGNRLSAVHVKDIAPDGDNLDEDGWADLGAGTLDWAALLKACRAQGEGINYVLEHDNPKDPMAYAKTSAAAFHQLWEATNG